MEEVPTQIDQQTICPVAHEIGTSTAFRSSSLHTSFTRASIDSQSVFPLAQFLTRFVTVDPGGGRRLAVLVPNALCWCDTTSRQARSSDELVTPPAVPPLRVFSDENRNTNCEIALDGADHLGPEGEEAVGVEFDS